MSVGSLEEIIDDNHAIVSTSVGSEHYVSILSFVDKDQLEPGKIPPLKIDRVCKINHCKKRQKKAIGKRFLCFSFFDFFLMVSLVSSMTLFFIT